MSPFVLAPEPKIENSCQENSVFAALFPPLAGKKDILRVCNLYSAFESCVMANDVNSSLKVSWAWPRASTLSPLRPVYPAATASCPSAGTARVVSAPGGRWLPASPVCTFTAPREALRLSAHGLVTATESHTAGTPQSQSQIGAGRAEQLWRARG